MPPSATAASIEKQGGPDEVTGSLSHAFSQIAAVGVTPETVQKALDTH